MPDCLLDQVQDQDFDFVILPGGQPGTDHLRKDARVLKLVRSRNEKKKMIGAICAAPLILRDAGIISGRQLTSHPSVEKELSDGKYNQTRVVVDGNIVTSRGPGTAMEFALKLVELMEGAGKVRELEKAMLVQKGG